MGRMSHSVGGKFAANTYTKKVTFSQSKLTQFRITRSLPLALLRLLTIYRAISG